MKHHAYIPVYALTLLLSAALLFSVQPMFSKMILPLLGGTPQVWNTAMLFFQVMLLGGYAYAHVTSRFLSINMQSSLHILLLFLFLVVMPISIPEGWLPPVDKDPTLWQLSLMTITVGGPFFVLAGSAPMLQRWFSETDHKDAGNPYFLYGASNLGSISALLAYPVLIEPFYELFLQSAYWMMGYLALILMMCIASLLAHPGKTKKKKKAKTAANDSNISWPLRFQWVVLAFAPSSLMLGVTTFITTDIASVPLLWILPLALYVGTFIIVFARRQIIKRDTVMMIQGMLFILLLVQMMAFHPPPAILILTHLALFFFSALACHTELATSRPSARHLTEFYLIMSIGGALGGFFNAIIAPSMFIIPLEYVLVLILVNFLRYSTDEKTSFNNAVTKLKEGIKTRNFITPYTIALFLIFCAAIISFALPHYNIYCVSAAIIAASLGFLIHTRWLFAMAAALVLLLYPPGYQWGQHIFKDIVHRDRNFFGVMRVVETYEEERLLLHGTTNHGAQPLDDEHKLRPLSYYSEFSPVNDVFRHLSAKRGKSKVAVVGLGIGVTACFKRDGRHFDFYEIDPDIAAIAENPDLFTYLSDCGSPYSIILGDGRLKIAEQPENHYDLILLDAFSSDNIPVHLLTREAVQLYLDKLKPDGVLVFNISNKYLDIEPVLAEIGKEMEIPTYARYTRGGQIEGTDLRGYAAHFLIMSPSERNIPFFLKRDWSEARSREGVKLWSDQFSNIVSVFGNKTGLRRHKELTAEENNE